MSTRTIKTFSVSKYEAQDCLININVDDETIIVVGLNREEDGTLYLTAWETANPDSDGIIENHYPEFFDEEVAQ